ncbi:MAG: M23 family metallopeptidase [Gemmatimonadota bacterium]
MTDGLKRWTIQFIRADGRRSRTLTAGRPGMLAGAVAVLLAILFAGFLVGRAWEIRSESAMIAVLRTELQTRRQDARQLRELSTRLGEIETDYARLRAAVTDGATTPVPSLAPPVALAGAPRTNRSPTTPAWPLAQRGFVTRTFGSRVDDGEQGHPGLDIAVPNGSYVRSMRAGMVEEAGEDDVYGRYVRIAHDGGLSSLYGHNSWLFVEPGDSVQRLQVIALSGNTGRSTAPHLHFEIAHDGELLDPLAFVNLGGGDGVIGAGQAGAEQR